MSGWNLTPKQEKIVVIIATIVVFGCALFGMAVAFWGSLKGFQ